MELHTEVGLLVFLSPRRVLTVEMVVEDHSPGVGLEVELAVGAEASAVGDCLHEADLVGQLHLGGLSESDLLAIDHLGFGAADEHEIGFGLQSGEHVGVSKSEHGQLLDLVELHPVGHILLSEVVGFQDHHVNLGFACLFVF